MLFCFNLFVIIIFTHYLLLLLLFKLVELWKKWTEFVPDELTGEGTIYAKSPDEVIDSDKIARAVKVKSNAAEKKKKKKNGAQPAHKMRKT